MELDRISDEDWTELSRRCASSVLSRARKIERREAFIKRFNQGAALVAVFLLVQFPLTCLAFEKIERAALNVVAQEFANQSNTY